MTRNYIRKKNVQPPSEEKLKLALGDVLRGCLTIRAAAEKQGLSKSTVGRYCKIHSKCGLIVPNEVKSNRKQQLIPPLLENEMVSYLKHCSLLNHGLTTIQCRKLAYSFAIANGIKVPVNWNLNKTASIDWLFYFLKRHPTLSIRKPEPTSQARASAFNKPVVMIFYDKLMDLKSRYKFKPNQIWNLDETSNPTVLSPPNVIAEKGMKQVQQTVSAERDDNVTMLAFICADGSYIPPTFVFPRKKMKPEFYDNGPVGCLGFGSETGWMTGENFLKSLQHFHQHVKSTKDSPILLTMDNHVSHLYYPAVNFAKENGIILFTFPPHCSHALQPLDISVFGPFKRFLAVSHNDWLLANPGKRISVKETAELSRGPFYSAFTPSNIISGFKAAGIEPFNRFAINEGRFCPSMVTDQPIDTTTTILQEKVLRGSDMINDIGTLNEVRLEDDVSALSSVEEVINAVIDLPEEALPAEDSNLIIHSISTST